jgi:hypothetical protein
VNVQKGTLVCDLFTKRNLLALSMIYNEIENQSDQVGCSGVEEAFRRDSSG